MKPYPSTLKRNARTLRTRMTDAEQKLWFRLRRKQLRGVQFYRQKPIGPYIVDFYAAQGMLVIEVDGAQHDSPEGRVADARRGAYLAGQGICILRFDNLQVLGELEAVLKTIEDALGERLGVAGIPTDVTP
jgi:very-short-patch-repair endonuclease